MDLKQMVTEGMAKLSDQRDMYQLFLSDWVEKIKTSDSNQKEKEKRINELHHVASFAIAMKYANVIGDVREITISEPAVEPDFIINYKNERIGLEITRVMNEQAEKVGSRNRLLKFSAKLFENKYPQINLLANIKFAEDFDARKFNSEEVKEQIADLVYLCHQKTAFSKPDFIRSIYCSKHDRVHFSLMGSLPGGSLDAEIAQGIKDKDENVGAYKAKSSIEKVWLLLVVSGASEESDFSEIDLSNFDTTNSFNSVFLLKDFDKKIYFLTPGWDKTF